MLIVLFHVNVEESHLLDVDSSLSIVGSKLGLRSVEAADCVIYSLLMEAHNLHRVVRNLFGDESDFVSDVLIGFAEHRVKRFSLANLGGRKCRNGGYRRQSQSFQRVLGDSCLRKQSIRYYDSFADPLKAGQGLIEDHWQTHSGQILTNELLNNLPEGHRFVWLQDRKLFPTILGRKYPGAFEVGVLILIRCNTFDLFLVRESLDYQLLVNGIHVVIFIALCFIHLRVQAV